MRPATSTRASTSNGCAGATSSSTAGSSSCGVGRELEAKDKLERWADRYRLYDARNMQGARTKLELPESDWELV
eukprot:12297435-Alexandrium_andersonii.AAC.1